MKKFFCAKYLSLMFVCCVIAGNAVAQNTNMDANLPSWLTRPMPLVDCLNIALQQSATILKARNDLEASYGVVVQTRAVALPQLQATGQYKDTDPDAIESFPIPNAPNQPNQNWNVGVQIVQSIYQGGKLFAALRAAKITKAQALAEYQTTIADALLGVRDGVLRRAARRATNHRSRGVGESAAKGIGRSADTGLMRAQFRNSTCCAPTFPLPMNVPNLIQARNNYRIAKNNLGQSAWLQSAARNLGRRSAEPDGHARRGAISNESA